PARDRAADGAGRRISWVQRCVVLLQAVPQVEPLVAHGASPSAAYEAAAINWCRTPHSCAGTAAAGMLAVGFQVQQISRVPFRDTRLPHCASAAYDTAEIVFSCSCSVSASDSSAASPSPSTASTDFERSDVTVPTTPVTASFARPASS